MTAAMPCGVAGTGCTARRGAAAGDSGERRPEDVGRDSCGLVGAAVALGGDTSTDGGFGGAASTRGAATEARFAAALANGVSGLIVELDGVGIDGVALVTQLATDPATAAVPLVGFCAHTRVDLIKDARAAGATKVVARGELHRRLPQIAAQVFA